MAETRDTDPVRIAALRTAVNALAVDLLDAPVEHVLLAPPHTVLKVRRAETRLTYERGMLTLGMRAQRTLRAACSGRGRRPRPRARP